MRARTRCEGHRSGGITGSILIERTQNVTYNKGRVFERNPNLLKFISCVNFTKEECSSLLGQEMNSTCDHQDVLKKRLFSNRNCQVYENADFVGLWRQFCWEAARMRATLHVRRSTTRKLCPPLDDLEIMSSTRQPRNYKPGGGMSAMALVIVQLRNNVFWYQKWIAPLPEYQRHSTERYSFVPPFQHNEHGWLVSVRKLCKPSSPCHGLSKLVKWWYVACFAPSDDFCLFRSLRWSLYSSLQMQASLCVARWHFNAIFRCEMRAKYYATRSLTDQYFYPKSFKLLSLQRCW